MCGNKNNCMETNSSLNPHPMFYELIFCISHNNNNGGAKQIWNVFILFLFHVVC